jgi:uncharacterized phage infection (PIP) family protein YhgE
MDEKMRPRSPAERIRTLAQAALNADETVDQMDHILDDLEVNLVGLNKAVGTMEASLEYFNQTLHRLNESLEQLESMMGRVQLAAVTQGRRQTAHGQQNAELYPVVALAGPVAPQQLHLQVVERFEVREPIEH